MIRNRTVLLYAAFAALSITVNVGTQGAVSETYRGSHSLVLSMILGTAAGLLCKYILDKHFIFAHKARSVSHEFTTFILYSVMGVATTAIFWITELLFHYFFTTSTMRYVGAVIGLVIGYVVKYWLDRRLVFR